MVKKNNLDFLKAENKYYTFVIHLEFKLITKKVVLV